jgi:hypothetical protein
MPNCIGNAFQVYFTIFLIKAQHTGGAFCGYIRTCAAHAVRYGFYAGFLSEPNSGFLYFPSRGSGKTVIFPRSHSVYAPLRIISRTAAK